MARIEVYNLDNFHRSNAWHRVYVRRGIGSEASNITAEVVRKINAELDWSTDIEGLSTVFFSDHARFGYCMFVYGDPEGPDFSDTDGFCGLIQQLYPDDDVYFEDANGEWERLDKSQVYFGKS